MTPCETCRPLVSDFAFGLLDAPEVAAVGAHLAGCDDCRVALRESRRLHELSKAASSADFPVAEFAPPAVPSTLEVRRTAREQLTRWAVAASLLLGVASLVPATLDGFKLAEVGRELADAHSKVDEAGATVAAADARLEEAVEANRARRADAEVALDRLASEWVTAEAEADSKRVRGPASAVAAAANTFTLKGFESARVQVADARGVTRFEQVVKPDGSVTLPPAIWGWDSPPARLRVESGGGAFERSLTPPTAATHLAIDRAVYKPGETVYARSLTLNRDDFRAPEVSVPVWFDVTGPRGTVPGSGRLAQTRPAYPSTNPVIGPDGQPVRGIGTAAIVLPPDLREGDYKVRVTTALGAGPDPDALPTTLPITIARVKPPAFDRAVRFDRASFAPGEEVRGTLTLGDPGAPLTNAAVTLHADATVGGERKVVAKKVALKTDAAGVAAFAFQLPAGDLSGAELTLTAVANGQTEWVRKLVPVTSPAVWLEAFPEGGECVAGIPGRVYLRATGANGDPADVTGAMLDAGREVARFRTSKGVGQFTWTPGANANLSPRLDGALKVAAFAAPKVTGDGVALTISPAVVGPNRPLQLTLTSTAARSVTVVASVRGVRVGHAKITAKAGEPTPVALKLDAPSGGVVRVTLFDGATPIAERLAFARPAKSLTLSATPAASGGSVTLDLAATDEAGQPTGAVLLAGVTAIPNRPGSPAMTPPAFFLLADAVHPPEALDSADILLGDAPGAAAELDGLLATQGWRHFAPAPARPLAGDSAFAGRARELQHVLAESRRPPDELVESRQRADQARARAGTTLTARQDAATPTTAAWANRRDWWPGAVALALAVGFALLGVSRLMDPTERRGLRLGGVGFVSVGIVAMVIGLAAPPTSHHQGLGGVGLVGSPPEATLPGDAAILALVPPGESELRPHRPLATEKPDFWRPSRPLRDAVERFDAGTRVVTESPAPSPVEALLGDGAVLVGESPLPSRLAKETAPERLAAARRIAARLGLPAAQVVREYAYVIPTGAGGIPGPGETLLWKPCVVTDQAGRASVSFDAPPRGGTYRVTLYGHTPDGRLGAATTRVVVGGR